MLCKWSGSMCLQWIFLSPDSVLPLSEDVLERWYYPGDELVPGDVSQSELCIMWELTNQSPVFRSLDRPRPIRGWLYLVISRPPGQVQLLGRPPPHLWSLWLGCLPDCKEEVRGQEWDLKWLTWTIWTATSSNADPSSQVQNSGSWGLPWFFPQLGIPNLSTALLTTFSGLNVFPKNNGW